jgi:hypothetical protein
MSQYEVAPVNCGLAAIWDCRATGRMDRGKGCPSGDRRGRVPGQGKARIACKAGILAVPLPGISRTGGCRVSWRRRGRGSLVQDGPGGPEALGTWRGRGCRGVFLFVPVVAGLSAGIRERRKRNNLGPCLGRMKYQRIRRFWRDSRGIGIFP